MYNKLNIKKQYMLDINISMNVQNIEVEQFKTNNKYLE